MAVAFLSFVTREAGAQKHLQRMLLFSNPIIMKHLLATELGSVYVLWAVSY